jgi:hypothetical protein
VASIREFNLVKLFVGVLVSDRTLIPAVEERLTADYGPIDDRSEIIPFQFTTYYAKEMGSSVDRVFFSFERLIEADQLPQIKRKTNSLEEELAGLKTTVERPVNLDPGYLEHAKVILASTKNFYHRIYLGGGIFGEVTMHFRNHTYQFFPWTYPDYQSEEYQAFFLRIRQIYREQLRTVCLLRR